MGLEKAVDVMLATDLLMLKDIYDVAILVSGDQDYVPAVRRAKDFGKTVINVSFLTRNGRLLPGGARRLSNATDASVQLPFDELRDHLCPGHTAAAQSGIVIPQRR
ncbi:MAG: NYN domain-containing protein [Methyloceanibacter sp.]